MKVLSVMDPPRKWTRGSISQNWFLTPTEILETLSVGWAIFEVKMDSLVGLDDV